MPRAVVAAAATLTATAATLAPASAQAAQAPPEPAQAPPEPADAQPAPAPKAPTAPAAPRQPADARPAPAPKGPTAPTPPARKEPAAPTRPAQKDPTAPAEPATQIAASERTAAATPTQGKAPPPEAPDLLLNRATSLAVVGGSFAILNTWAYFAWYRHRTTSDHLIWKDEGWFGPDTYAGGSDKLGHFWVNYILIASLRTSWPKGGGSPCLER